MQNPVEVVEIVVDYFAKWPIKVGHTYDGGWELRERLSPALVREVEELRDFWNDSFAIGDPGNPPPFPPAVIDEWRRRVETLRKHLQDELGEGFEVR